MRILLIDDDRLGRVMLAQGLRSDTCEVVDVESAEEALLAWDAQVFDAIVSDILMDGMNGVEMAEIMRASEAGGARPRARMVALTASAVDARASEAMRVHFDVVLDKPASAAQVRAALAGD